MGKKLFVLTILSFCLVFSGIARATPLDLTGFSTSGEAGSVSELAGVVTFSENFTDAALYFYNDSFSVPLSATKLSFDYEFALGEFDEGDYLQFNINHSQWWSTAVNGSGHIDIDIKFLQGQTISLDWGLIWNGDIYSGTTALIKNIDLIANNTSTPVPEPAMSILMAIGLAGLAGIKRKLNLT